MFRTLLIVKNICIYSSKVQWVYCRSHGEAIDNMVRGWRYVLLSDLWCGHHILLYYMFQLFLICACLSEIQLHWPAWNWEVEHFHSFSLIWCESYNASSKDHHCIERRLCFRLSGTSLQEVPWSSLKELIFWTRASTRLKDVKELSVVTFRPFPVKGSTSFKTTCSKRERLDGWWSSFPKQGNLLTKKELGIIVGSCPKCDSRFVRQ